MRNTKNKSLKLLITDRARKQCIRPDGGLTSSSHYPVLKVYRTDFLWSNDKIMRSHLLSYGPISRRASTTFFIILHPYLMVRRGMRCNVRQNTRFPVLVTAGEDLLSYHIHCTPCQGLAWPHNYSHFNLQSSYFAD